MEITKDTKQTAYGTSTCLTSNIENPKYKFSQIEMKEGFETGFLKMKNNFITNVVIRGSVEVSSLDANGKLKKSKYDAKDGWVVLPNGIQKIQALEDTIYFQMINWPEGEISRYENIQNVQNGLQGKDHVVPVSKYHVAKPWGGEDWLVDPEFLRGLG